MGHNRRYASHDIKPIWRQLSRQHRACDGVTLARQRSSTNCGTVFCAAAIAICSPFRQRTCALLRCCRRSRRGACTAAAPRGRSSGSTCGSRGLLAELVQHVGRAARFQALRVDIETLGQHLEEPLGRAGAKQLALRRADAVADADYGVEVAEFGGVSLAIPASA